METKLEFKSDSQILCEIFSFYRDNYMGCQRLASGDSPVSLADMFVDKKTREIQEAGKIYADSIIKDFEEKSFCDTKAYTCNQVSNEDFFKCMMFCSDIKEKIHENLSPEKKEYNKRMESYGKLERKVSPPIEAYKYVPFNKMNIKYSNKSYGLLFE